MVNSIHHHKSPSRKNLKATLSSSVDKAKYLTTEEAATLLRTSPRGLRQMRYRNQLPPGLVVRPNGGKRTRLLFDRAQLERLMRERAEQ